jgi:SAM-dependent methyltransferase
MHLFEGWQLISRPGTKYYANRVEFIDTVIKNKTLKILDVGAGGLSGNIPEKYRPMSRYIYQTVGRDNYTALEYDPAGADVMEKKFGVHNIQVGDIANYKSQDRFDAIYCGLILPVVYDLDAALSNIRQLLRPNGILICDFPNFMWYRNIARYAYKSKTRLDCDKFHWHHETVDSLAKKLEKKNFRVIETSFIAGNRQPFFMPAKYAEFIGSIAVSN